MFVLIAACGGDGDASNGAIVISTIDPNSMPVSPTATTVPPTPTDGSHKRGFSFPIAGGCLPSGDQLMPNAPREYRFGTHEGVDMYNVDNCTGIGQGTPVIAAKAGRVIRIDHDYVDLTEADVVRLFDNPTTEDALDAFRGRQVWIDHGFGIVTRYCHLSAVATDLQVGSQVAVGQLVGNVGESGTPESVREPGTQYHLHFELRVDDSYLGAGLPPAEVRTLFETLFSP